MSQNTGSPPLRCPPVIRLLRRAHASAWARGVTLLAAGALTTSHIAHWLACKLTERSRDFAKSDKGNWGNWKEASEKRPVRHTVRIVRLLIYRQPSAVWKNTRWWTFYWPRYSSFVLFFTRSTHHLCFPLHRRRIKVILKFALKLQRDSLKLPLQSKLSLNFANRAPWVQVAVYPRRA